MCPHHHPTPLQAPPDPPPLGPAIMQQLLGVPVPGAPGGPAVAPAPAPAVPGMPSMPPLPTDAPLPGQPPLPGM